ncbi:hypothetical protein A176_006164 [Myxococcus hansupus]|uniref:Uncharacterized protein n=1 Tax=Pseudomyxococcus hansupus TaxID=1297742 RepID=A0A0H4XLV3_9BACT|nr:hypothetical protein A176_006164 [Myxococcus hansupus]
MPGLRLGTRPATGTHQHERNEGGAFSSAGQAAQGARWSARSPRPIFHDVAL